MSELMEKTNFASALVCAFLGGAMFWAMCSGLPEKIGKNYFESDAAEKTGDVAAARETEKVLPEADGSLLQALKREFQRRNPEIEKVCVTDARVVDSETGKHLVIGRATRIEADFRGSFDDELFGFFVVDLTTNRIEKILDIVSSPRFHDTEMRLEKFKTGEALVVGRSMDLGHVEWQRKYRF